MDMIVDIINSIDAFVWGPPMLVLLLGSHIFLTFRTGFIQRKLPTASNCIQCGRCVNACPLGLAAKDIVVAFN